jgi:predicted alpha-1,2-mannosidase
MKNLLRLLFASALLLTLFSCQQKPDLSSHVNPFIGTGGHGHTYPGASMPFGMVQLSPDTRIDGSWDGCSGYHFSDSLIYGFSHTHLSGTGVSDYGDFMMMPLSQKPDLEQKTFESTYTDQTASPGYYAVKLGSGIHVELSASTRVGFQRIQFPESKAYLVMDLKHRDYLIEGAFNLVDNKNLGIYRISSAWAKEQYAYAWVNFSAPYTCTLSKDSTKALFTFELDDKELLIKTGFSFVSEDGAKKNLEAEITHWDFDQQKKAARESWNMALGKIEIFTTDIDELTKFYTALYHVMLQPNLAMDVDRKYRGRDNKIHTAEDFDYYTVFSLWDTFRAAHPLYTLIDRKRTNDFIRTFLAQYEQGGRLPVWEFASNETDCMIGYHSVSVIADAAAKGILDYDQNLALEAMQKSATWNHLGVPEYIKNGFLSVDDEHESVSKTLEYAYDDWCIAQMAKILENKTVYDAYMKRSQAWKNLLDPETGFMRPRTNGDWIKPFDPREVNNHFTEGNSWQYSFFVPQDVYGMIEQMGGTAKFEAQLDQLFTTESQTTGRTQADITGLIGQYAHGNEPSHHMALLYHYVGKPGKSIDLLQQIMDEFYTPLPDGLIGNEDCGQMSAWFVLNSLGIYQINPGADYFLLHAPRYEKALIKLENGKLLEITAEGVNNTTKYAQSISLNQKELKSFSHISYDELMQGGQLSFSMSQEPINYTAVHMPPKEDQGEAIVHVPTIHASGRSFIDTLYFTIHGQKDKQIYYTLDNTTPDSTSIPYQGKVLMEESTHIRAVAMDQDGSYSGVARASFFKKPNQYSLELHCEYNPQYHAEGPGGLLDGIKGTTNWRKGDWQGYQDQDFEAVVDLKQEKSIQSVSARFLQDTRSWIIFPTQVEFLFSNDGIHFFDSVEVSHDFPADDYEVSIITLEHGLSKRIQARYMKIRAKNFGTLPEWHMGAGHQAFIFIDEIEIKP